MKKSILLLIITTGILLTGCNKETKIDSLLNDTSTLSPSTLENVDAPADIYLSLDKDTYTNSDTVIKYQIHNDTAEEQTYGAAYYLEFLSDGTWYSVPSKDGEGRFFIEVAYMLAPNSTTETLEIDLEESTPLIKGTYRLIKNVSGTNIYKEFQYK